MKSLFGLAHNIERGVYTTFGLVLVRDTVLFGKVEWFRQLEKRRLTVNYHIDLWVIGFERHFRIEFFELFNQYNIVTDFNGATIIEHVRCPSINWCITLCCHRWEPLITHRCRYIIPNLWHRVKLYVKFSEASYKKVECNDTNFDRSWKITVTIRMTVISSHRMMSLERFNPAPCFRGIDINKFFYAIYLNFIKF